MFGSLGATCRTSRRPGRGRYTYQSDVNGVLSMTYEDPLGRCWTHVSDALGNRLREIDPTGQVCTFVYQGFRLQRQIDPLGRETSFSYDGNQRLTGAKNPLGAITTSTRDAWGNVLTHMDALGHVTTYGYGANPALRQVHAVMNALGQITSHGYSAWGAREYQEDPLGYRHTWQWNDRGLLEAEINPLGYRTTILHADIGNRIARVDPLGNRLSQSLKTTMSGRVSRSCSVPLGILAGTGTRVCSGNRSGQRMTGAFGQCKELKRLAGLQNFARRSTMATQIPALDMAPHSLCSVERLEEW